MGSSTSCAYRSAPAAGSKSVKVIDGEGRLQEFSHAVRAAELMAENPGQFVCDAASLQVGCRIPGLASCETLARRRLYFLLPTDLLYSALTEEEMAWLLRRAATAKRSRKGRTGIGLRKTREEVEVEEEKRSGVCQAEQIKKVDDRRRSGGAPVMQRSRSWEPELDTIQE